ncbi:MAG: tetratricopeptide repeat protein [Cyanobacteria bacterium HKST-UBA02]|nr:tetratricopeptide repeat protein [Cyanobacteria bacterium HKST-UBA02]
MSANGPSAPGETKNVEMPPAQKSMVREIFCVQLLAALVTCGLFAFTVVSPVVIKPMEITNPTATTEGFDYSKDNEELLEGINSKEPMRLLEEGKVVEARARAWEIGNTWKKRKDVQEMMAAGNVLTDSDTTRDIWKGFRLLEKSLELAPKSKFVRLNFARQLFKRGQTEKAEEMYEDLLKISDPSWVTPRIELAEIYLMDDKTLRSIELFNEVLKERPKDPRITKRLGLALTVNGDRDKGFDTFVQGCAYEQDNQDWQPEIKKLIEKNAGLIESAISDVYSQVEAHPDDIKLKIKLARLQIAYNRLKDAKKHLLDARKKRETDPEVHEVLSEVLFRLGNTEEARAEFGTTARLLPLSKPAAPPVPYEPTQEEMDKEVELNSIVSEEQLKELEAEKKAAEEGAAEEKAPDEAPAEEAKEE